MRTSLQETESWRGSLPTTEDKEIFKRMLNGCYKYTVTINVKGSKISSALKANLLIVLGDSDPPNGNTLPANQITCAR
jgi:Ca2+-binding RTX toxin-like protein